jgi:hypothetical protein
MYREHSLQFISETSLAADMYHMRQCSVKTEEHMRRKMLSLAALRTSASSTICEQPKRDKNWSKE